MSNTLSQATSEYLATLEKAGKSRRTLYTYGVDMATLMVFFGSDTLLKDITSMMVGRFLRSDILLVNRRSQRPRSDITIQKNIRVMRQFFIWAHETGRIEKLPLPKAVPMGRDGTAASA